MKTLQEIYDEVVQKYPNRHTDKGMGAYGPVENGPGHTYAQIYDLLLAKYRTTTGGLLEIGINKGGSLKMWREYFPNAEVCGIDIRNSFDEFDPRERILTLVADANDDMSVAKFLSGKSFFTIIDDGAHEADSQIRLYNKYSKYVAHGGIYIVEDVQNIDKDFPRFLSGIAKKPTIIDRRAINGQRDDVLLVYQF